MSHRRVWDRYRLQYKGDCSCGLYQVCRKILGRDPYEGVESTVTAPPGLLTDKVSQGQLDACNPFHHTYRERVEWMKGLAEKVSGEEDCSVSRDSCVP